MDLLEKYKATIVEQDGAKIAVSDGFTLEKWDLDFHDYMSPSQMKKLIVSGAHFAWKYIEGREDPDTPSKRKGRLLHWALLEPAEFRRRYVIEPKFSGEGMRKAKADWRAGVAPDAILMDEEDAQEIIDMIEAISRHPDASKLLKNSVNELRAFAKDPVLVDHNGDPINWHCILDGYRNGNVVLEVKTTRDPRPHSFERDCLTFGYHIQTWINRHVVELITGQRPQVMIIAIQNTAPYCVEVYALSDLWFETAFDYIQKGLKTYRDGMKSGNWFGYSGDPVGKEIKALALPVYANLEQEEISGTWDPTATNT